ncbi:hypothetical protein [Tautonia rosea]|uniref:hypothetical protein n=1 Tax=Tautonia rosea TaxID=2728037 RepID=UPI0014744662|nr:hypothetical protein [Tautonia rosea]
MKPPILRRRPGKAPSVESLEARQLLSMANPMPPGKAAEIVNQSFHNARPAPQSPSPVTTRVSLLTDRPNYAPGEPIALTLTQAVAGNTPVNTGPLGNYDVIVSQRGRELWRLSDDRGPVIASHVLITMQPGESRQVTTTWDGRGRDGRPLTGPVEIRAVIDRVESPPRTIQIGVAAPSQARPTLAARRPSPVAFNRPAPILAHRPTPIQAHRPNREHSVNVAQARQQFQHQQQQQLQRAAEARQITFSRPAPPTLAGSQPLRRFS